MKVTLKLTQAAFSSMRWSPCQHTPFFALRLAVVMMAISAVLATPARAQLEVDVTRGNIDPLRIAIPVFVGATSADDGAAEQLTGVIAGDLERSGLFIPLDPASYIERISTIDRAPRFADWQVINAQALLTGRLARLADGRIQAEFRLWDVFSGRQLAANRFTAGADNWRRIAHMIADAVYERMTGEKGYFDTRVVFVDEQGPKDARVKRLAIMDQDGFNVRLLSTGRSLVLTPRFSPTAQLITFMSYENGRPKVHLMNLETGQQEQLGNFNQMTFAPRFSPDGQRIVFSLQEEGRSNIFEMDIRTRQLRQLTNGVALDTGPSYAPNGAQIVFESDRDGTQQIYVMNADGSNARRISYGEGRYSTPVWSPRGDLIAFTKLYQGRFLIGVMRPNGTGERILTSGFHNEGPTWAPNGRVLMFFRESQGENGGPKLYSVDLTGYNERQIQTPSFASDPAWSPLLN